jgi:hypothetical protein
VVFFQNTQQRQQLSNIQQQAGSHVGWRVQLDHWVTLEGDVPINVPVPAAWNGPEAKYYWRTIYMNAVTNYWKGDKAALKPCAA